VERSSVDDNAANSLWIRSVATENTRVSCFMTSGELE
jgi:hypothetical protein